jgi:hypothetical protein
MTLSARAAARETEAGAKRDPSARKRSGPKWIAGQPLR